MPETKEMMTLPGRKLVVVPNVQQLSNVLLVYGVLALHSLTKKLVTGAPPACALAEASELKLNPFRFTVGVVMNWSRKPELKPAA